MVARESALAARYSTRQAALGNATFRSLSNEALGAPRSNEALAAREPIDAVGVPRSIVARRGRWLRADFDR
jgi:hypothetical protein